MNEQDSEAEIMDCVETVLRYEQGHRPERPEFGLRDLVFTESHIGADEIQDTLYEWEPRIITRVGQSIIDEVDNLIQTIRIEGPRNE